MPRQFVPASDLMVGEEVWLRVTRRGTGRAVALRGEVVRVLDARKAAARGLLVTVLVKVGRDIIPLNALDLYKRQEDVPCGSGNG